VRARDGVTDDPQVTRAVAAAEARLATRGRILVRPSGTEPLVRVMVEAEHQGEAEGLAADIAAVIAARHGATS
jgi:phosphoglucosamine mutase